MSKTRVAPRQPVSLPRLELQAAVLACRLRDYFVGQLSVPVDRVSFYTDSMVAYHWCTSASPGRWKTFVANRCEEIQRSSKPSEWFHIGGSSNIADLGTRGISAMGLCDDEQWWGGPRWLRLPEPDRPTSQPGQEIEPSTPEAHDEMRHNVVAALVARPVLGLPVEISHFSLFGRLVRTIEAVFRAVSLMRRGTPLDAAAARAEAVAHLARTTQREFFAREIVAAAAGDDAPRGSKLGGFKLFLDDSGVLRAKTRLRETPNFTFSSPSRFHPRRQIVACSMKGLRK